MKLLLVILLILLSNLAVVCAELPPKLIPAWPKRFEIPPEKLFTKVLIKRFEWASNVDRDYRF